MERELKSQIEAKDQELEQERIKIQSNQNEQAQALNDQISKLREANDKLKGDVDTLKAQKKEQSLKVAKQAKENLMKQKED